MSVLVVTEYVIDKKYHYIYNPDKDGINDYVFGCLITVIAIDLLILYSVFFMLLSQIYSISKGLTFLENLHKIDQNQVSSTNQP